MNAGQHLLSAVVEQVAGADTLSWELHPRQPDSATADTVTIDLSVPSLTPKQMSDIEAQCNTHIRAARSIRQLVLDGSSKGQAERRAVIEKGNLRGKLPPAAVIEVTMASLPRAHSCLTRACCADAVQRSSTSIKACHLLLCMSVTKNGTYNLMQPALCHESSSVIQA